MTDRHAYINGLRKLAEWLETEPEVPLPDNGQVLPMTWGFWPHHKTDPRDELARMARAFPGTVLNKNVDDTYFRLRGVLGGAGGVEVSFVAYRDAVCVRHVVGTEEVEVEAREGDDTRPIVKRTEKRELVEWECPPLLAETGADS